MLTPLVCVWDNGPSLWASHYSVCEASEKLVWHCQPLLGSCAVVQGRRGGEIRKPRSGSDGGTLCAVRSPWVLNDPSPSGPEAFGK